MTKPPPWIDEEACLEFIKAELIQLADDEEREFYMRDWGTHPGVPADEVVRNIEQQAVDKAKKGQWKELAALIRPSHPLNDKHGFVGRPLREHLSPEAWTLIAERLEGKKHAKRARPKMSEEERRAKNPVHNAADLAETIEQMLGRHYADVLDEDRRARAIDFAALIEGIDNTTLRNHVRRGKNDRRRIGPKK